MSAPPIDKMEFRGGRLCLDFVNTANWAAETPIDDRLTDAGALAIWLERQRLGLLDDPDGDLGLLKQLRQIIRLFFTEPGSATDDDTASFNAARAHSAAVEMAAGTASLKSPVTVDAVARVVADSAAQLLLTNPGTRIKMCPGERCGWLFYDDSPTNRRRWCSMADCGNKAKAKKFYHANKKR